MFRAFRDAVEAAVADALSAMDLPTDDLGVEEPPEDVIHLHGEVDRTLPVERVDPTDVIEGGTHMMTLVLAEEVSQHLQNYLAE